MPSESQLKEDLKQNWLFHKQANSYTDQFGFTIISTVLHELQYKGQTVYEFYTLDAAKLVSTIILNDIIERHYLKKKSQHHV